MMIRRLNRPFTINNELDQFFHDFFHAPTTALKENKKRFWGETPAVNVEEKESNYTLTVAVPGMKKEDFKIEVLEGVLSISAEVDTEKTDEKDKYTRREFNYSSFERKFALPENVKEDNINALYKDGILSVEIPKAEAQTEEEKRKLINIA